MSSDLMRPPNLPLQIEWLFYIPRYTVIPDPYSLPGRHSGVMTILSCILLMQLVLTFFILVAQVINLIVHVTKATRWGWRLSLAFAFVPSSILFFGEPRPDFGPIYCTLPC